MTKNEDNFSETIKDRIMATELQPYMFIFMVVFLIIDFIDSQTFYDFFGPSEILLQPNISKHKIKSVQQCIINCEKLFDCSFINYNEDTLVCNIYFTRNGLLNTTASAEWKIFIKGREKRLLSHGKPSKQSSIFKNWTSNLAFDGGLDQRIHRGTCQHTLGNEDIPWLEVDLESVFFIREVKIFNRLDSYSLRLEYVSIFVYEDDMDGKELCKYFESISTADQIQTFRCNSLIKGRYVRLQMANRQFLHICEMQVFGY